MDLRTIKTFKAIVKYGSFQQAAESLNYAQSTVTTHIKKLESILGVTLLERGNNLQLTEAGRLLDEKGEILLKSFEHLENSMIDLVEGDSKLIRIGVMEPMASYRFPLLLKSFMEKHPNVQVSLQIHGSKVLVDMLMKDEIDVAICAAPVKNGGMVFEYLLQEEAVLLLPNDHLLNKQETIRLADLQSEKLVITNAYCPFRGIFENKMIENGLVPSYGIEVSNMLTLKYYVQSGFGPAIVPLVAVNPAPKGTTMRKIVDFDKGLNVGLLRKADQHTNATIVALLETIKQYK